MIGYGAGASCITAKQQEVIGYGAGASYITTEQQEVIGYGAEASCITAEQWLRCCDILHHQRATRGDRLRAGSSCITIEQQDLIIGFDAATSCITAVQQEVIYSYI